MNLTDLRRAARFGALALLLLSAACGSNQYGSAGAFNFKEQTPASFNLPTPSGNSAAALGEGQKAGGGLGTQGGGTHATPSPAAQQLAEFPISIYSDVAQNQGFYPKGANVYKGVVIVFTNRDTKPHSVVSSSGDPASFNSGLIQPGKSWSYTTTVLGRFDYSDGTRPYQVAYFDVVPK